MSDQPKPRSRKPKPEGAENAPKEPKDVKFRRLALKRVPAALKRLQHVTNLANKNQYEFTPEQAAKIVDAISGATKRLIDAYSGVHSAVDEFTL